MFRLVFFVYDLYNPDFREKLHIPYTFGVMTIQWDIMIVY